jgi:hypothetical protein
MAQFPPGTNIWAKMKGYPPWPAVIITMDEVNTDPNRKCPAGKIPILCLGTNEMAFLKPNEIVPFEEHRAEYEIPKKAKGFNEAVVAMHQENGKQYTRVSDILIEQLQAQLRMKYEQSSRSHLLQ